MDINLPLILMVAVAITGAIWFEKSTRKIGIFFTRVNDAERPESAQCKSRFRHIIGGTREGNSGAVGDDRGNDGVPYRT